MDQLIGVRKSLITDSRGSSLKDTHAQSLRVIEADHSRIHEEVHYVVPDVQNVATTTMKWMITTPDSDIQMHMLFEIECTGEMLVLITQGADRTGTTALSKMNRYLSSTRVSSASIHRGTSGGTTDGADVLYNKRVGATGPRSPGNIGRGNEFILKRNTKYVVSITTFADVYVSLNLDWYEYEDVD